MRYGSALFRYRLPRSPMHILHVFKTYLPEGFAGVERVIHAIAEGAAEEGIRSTVFTLGTSASRGRLPVGRHGVVVARRDLDLASTPIAFGAAGQFRRLAREADLIHYHFPWPMMDLWHLFAGGTTKPSLVTYHSDIVKQAALLRLYRPLMMRFLGSVDWIVATSPNYLATSPVLGAFRDKVSVIPLGIDPAPFAAPDPARVLFWREKLPARFFLFVGELRYYKGLPFLLEAARQTGLPVVLVGKGSADQPSFGAIPPHVHVLGPVDDSDKAALLHLAESFVFPSHLRSEAFGVALLEAAFSGKPMISCEIGTGTSYANVDGETGLVVAPADPGALASAMTTLWHDPALRQGFGAAARLRAQALFRGDQMSAAYCDLYRELLRKDVALKPAPQ
nr:glycosyltransferase [Tianweitania sediminis]